MLTKVGPRFQALFFSDSRQETKKDWIQTVANVGSADHVWFDNVIGREGSLSFSIPENGMYQVILVKLDTKPASVTPKRKSAHDLIGYCRKFHPEYRSTADIMHDLREGEKA